MALTLRVAVPALANAQQVAAPALVFDGVAVVDVEDGKLVRDQRVVVTGNRIHAVGSPAAVPVPSGAQVIDAHGKYLIPGLWEMHAHPMHMAPVFYPLFIANGITGMRDAWSKVSIDTIVQWRQEILAGTRVGPTRQVLTGNGIGAIHFTPAQLQRQVDSLKAHGANAIKGWAWSYALGAAARRAGLPSGGHLPEGSSAGEASDSGISIIDHLMNLTSGGLDSICWGPEPKADQCQSLAEKFRRNGTWLVPTLVRVGGTSGSDAVSDLLDHYGVCVDSFWQGSFPHGNWLRTPQACSQAQSSTGPGGKQPNANKSNGKKSNGKKPGVKQPENAAPEGYMSLMQRLDFPLLAGTDDDYVVVGDGAQLPGLSTHLEIALYVAEGLSPLHALQSTTLNPAKYLHGTDSLGTVAEGKLADLVLLDANPLADITNTTQIRAVVANGRYFDRAALDQLYVDALAAAKKIQAEQAVADSLKALETPATPEAPSEP